MRITLAFCMLLACLPAHSQSNENHLEAWGNSGYTVEAFFAETYMQADFCLSEKENYTSCLVALGYLLSEMDRPHVLAWDDENKDFFIEEAPLDHKVMGTLSRTVSRELSQLSFQWVEKESLESLFENLKEVYEAGLPARKKFFLLGSAYNLHIRETIDSHMSLMPHSTLSPDRPPYVGVGMGVTKVNDKNSPWYGAVAISPNPGSPAENAQLKKGDIITAVDGQPVQDLNLQEVVDLILGEPNTDVVFTVQSVCEKQEVTRVATRDRIQVRHDIVADSRFVSIDGDNWADPVAEVCGDQQEIKQGLPQALYVPIRSFGVRPGQDLCREFRDVQLKDMRNPNSRGMIIDLRNNGGGRLDMVSCMLDSLHLENDGELIGEVPVEGGRALIEEKKTIMKTTDRHSFAFPNPLNPTQRIFRSYNRPVIVLVNGRSASASEIMAGALQDWHRGWVVGERTFGKGSMQTIKPHENPFAQASLQDDALAFGATTGIFTLPSGRSPQKVGIEPDFYYDIMGEAVVEPDDFQTGEAAGGRAVEFPQEPWEQTRPDEVARISSCAKSENSQSESFKQAAQEDERYGRTTIADYQLFLAKDILRCSGS